MRDPVKFAKELAKKQTPGYALAMAEKAVQEMQVSLGLGGTPFADEVETQEHTYADKETLQQKSRTVTIVDEGAKAARMRKTLVFWKNVVGYLRRRQPKKPDSTAA